MIRAEQQPLVGKLVNDQSPFLADLVKRYQVCWEVWPECLMVSGNVRQIGFELELSATHEFETEHDGPGCPACQRIYGALHALADWILPREERPSMYEIGPYETALRYSAVRRNRPDVTLSVKIVHRRGFEQPVDDCELRCLKEMKGHLAELGACERQWSLRMSTTA